MQAESNPSPTHKQQLDSADDAGRGVDQEKQTFILPFVVLAFLALPNLGVLAISKPTIGFEALEQAGYYKFVQSAFWVAVPLALIFGVLYLVRGESKLGKAAVAGLMVVLAASFAYVMWPK